MEQSVRQKREEVDSPKNQEHEMSNGSSILIILHALSFVNGTADHVAGNCTNDYCQGV